MALNSASVWEVRTAGSDLNGGAFVAGATGTDFSQQDAARTGADVTNISTTDAVGNGTTTLTSATANFTAAIVGNTIYLQGGTGTLTATRRQIVTFTNATTVVLDASVAAGTGITMNVGGALASPGICAAFFQAENTAFIKNGTYTISSATINIANGVWSNSNRGRVIGYGTTRAFGNSDAAPLLQLTVNTATIWSGGPLQSVYNLSLDANSGTTRRTHAGGLFIKCDFLNASASTATSNFPVCIGCRVTGCTATMLDGPCYYCEAYGNTATPFVCATAVYCLSYANTGATTDGFTFATLTAAFVIGCVAYNNGRDGFRFANNVQSVAQNSVAEANAGIGFNAPTSSTWVSLINCATFGNGTPTAGSALQSIGDITGSGSFFTNAAGNDFTLNNTSGAGAALRVTAAIRITDQFYPRGVTRSFLDIGAAQHQDAATGGGLRLAGRGGLAAGA